MAWNGPISTGAQMYQPCRNINDIIILCLEMERLQLALKCNDSVKILKTLSIHSQTAVRNISSKF